MPLPPPILYKYLDADSAIKTLENCTLKFSSPLSLNDPFEFLRGDVPEKYNEYLYMRFKQAEKSDEAWAKACKELFGFRSADKEQEMRFLSMHPGLLQFRINEEITARKRFYDNWQKEHLIESGICCFSETNRNILMWGHYADKFKGCVIGFNTARFEGWHKVIYRKKRIPLLCGKENDAAVALDCMTRKACDWRYEREWRLISDIGSLTMKGGLLVKVFDASCIRQIIIGMKANDNLKQAALLFHKDNHCDLCCIETHPHKYQLEVKPFSEVRADNIFSNGAHP